jgi:hypothetical protein
VIAVSAAAAAVSSTAARAPFTIVAHNLDNPRHLFVGSHGRLYVAEAGAGGRDRCLGTGARKACVGLTGSITEIAGGRQQRVVVGLVSVAGLDETRAEGPAALVVEHGRFDVLLQDDFLTSRGTNRLGRDGTAAGTLSWTPPGLAQPHVIANLAAFEAAHNPDHGAGPGAALGDPPIDSDPYAVVPYRGGFAVADAAANDLLWIDPKGRISVLAVFPTQTARLTAADRKEFRLPARLRTISVQSVPSGLAVGPDGALYIGELTGVPFRPGLARVWRVVPGRKASVYASGFTNISDLAFDGRNLLVLEIASGGLGLANSHGALIRLAPGGRRTVIASTGLVAPTGVAVDRGAIYVSNYGIFAGAGAGPHGEVVRLAG